MVSSFLVADDDKENDGLEALSVGFAAGAPKENADLVPALEEESVDD